MNFALRKPPTMDLATPTLLAFVHADFNSHMIPFFRNHLPELQWRQILFGA